MSSYNPRCGFNWQAYRPFGPSTWYSFFASAEIHDVVADVVSGSRQGDSHCDYNAAQPVHNPQRQLDNSSSLSDKQPVASPVVPSDQYHKHSLYQMANVHRPRTPDSTVNVPGSRPFCQICLGNEDFAVLSRCNLCNSWSHRECREMPPYPKTTNPRCLNCTITLWSTVQAAMLPPLQSASRPQSNTPAQPQSQWLLQQPLHTNFPATFTPSYTSFSHPLPSASQDPAANAPVNTETLPSQQPPTTTQAAPTTQPAQVNVPGNTQPSA